MSDPTYTPPKVWQWEPGNGGKFANINRPVAGATHDKHLPVGKHPLQLYSLATPNGVKVTVMLEELLEKGITDAEYDAHLIQIGEGDQFGSGFVEVNPNSKIPALMDHSVQPPQRVFESGAILLYLAEKFGAFLPSDPAKRTECLSWLFWQMGSAPMLGGGFGHFYAYAPEKYQYPIDRYTMEVKRQLDVLDRRLAEAEYLNGVDYSIADMASYPWVTIHERQHQKIDDFPNVKKWLDTIAARPAVKKTEDIGKDLYQGPDKLTPEEREKLAGAEMVRRLRCIDSRAPKAPASL